MSHWLEVTELINGRVGIYVQAAWLRVCAFNHSIMLHVTRPVNG